MTKSLRVILICFIILCINTLAFGESKKFNTYNKKILDNFITDQAIESIRKGQGIVEIRIEHLDGTVTHNTGSGFLIDKANNFIITSIHILPDSKAVVEDKQAITFYKIDDDNTVEEAHAYVYATSQEYELAILQIDGKLPKGMDEVVFAKDLSLNNPVYARLNRPVNARAEPLDVGSLEVVSFRGRTVEGALAPGSTPESGQRMDPHLFLDPAVAFFGEMVVDAVGRVVGMGNGIRRGHAVLTSALVIQKALAEAHEAEQKIAQRGGVTPSETHTIKHLSHIFEQIMQLYATQALVRPRDIRNCAYEMFAMRPSGECRDVFSTYLPPAQARQSTQAFDGNFGGIGLKMIMKQGMVEVVTPFTNTPAARAGIRPGDVLKEVDGKRVTGVTETAELLHGSPGTEVALTVSRKGDSGEPEERRFTVVREMLTMKTVTTQVVQGEHDEPVGVVTIREFRENTADQFQEALDYFENQHIENLVVDVRNNPGGSFGAAVRMLALFMERNDTVLVLRERHAEHALSGKILATEYGAHDFGTFRALKLVILINGGSASAAEIFAGTLQDWGYPVVGEKSFGKGVAQSPVTLSDNSMFILTMFEFFVGNHLVPIRDKGVLPNVIVANRNAHEDTQLNKAIEILSVAEEQTFAVKK